MPPNWERRDLKASTDTFNDEFLSVVYAMDLISIGYSCCGFISIGGGGTTIKNLQVDEVYLRQRCRT